MKNYYFTFMFSQSDLRNNFVKITAENWLHAREKMFERFGKEWAFQYEEEEFLPQIEKYNLQQI